jgi:hypothetical protein
VFISTGSEEYSVANQETQDQVTVDLNSFTDFLFIDCQAAVPIVSLNHIAAKTFSGSISKKLFYLSSDGFNFYPEFFSAQICTFTSLQFASDLNLHLAHSVFRI